MQIVSTRKMSTSSTIRIPYSKKQNRRRSFGAACKKQTEEGKILQSVYKVEMEGITKTFGGVYALKNASFRVKPGEIHALVGENGAGKSTLMKILSGAVQMDSGTIRIDGQACNITSPKVSKDLGVAVIYQEFMLAPHLTVAENIFIDRLSGKKPVIDWRNLKKQAGELLDKLGFGDIDAGMPVADLPVAYQQIVEICKSLAKNEKILVLDEPTAVLTFSEIEKLFGLLRSLRAQGIGIVYISHRLDEIFELCDAVTVLKDGMLVKELNIKDTDKKSLINLMVGRELSTLFPERNATIGETLLEAKHICAGRMVDDVSFSVRRGEVLGFSGLVGAGRTETMRAIFGADKMESGKVVYQGKEVLLKSPVDAVGRKIGLVPEDRKNQGVLIEQSIRVNTTLTSLGRVSKMGIIKHKKDKEFSKKILAELATKYASVEDNVSSLSGGNQQKIALAKWLAADCQCMILDEPTRGVDVGAKAEIYKNINKLAESGMAIIMISSEMEEIINMCDRVMIMRQGKIVGELEKNEMTENNLIKLSMGVR